MGKWRRVIPGLIVLALFIQGGLGEAIFLRHLSRIWLSFTEPAERQQIENDFKEFTAFVETHIPRGATVLYVTAQAQSEQLWAYFQFSYALYPSTVWWITPVAKSSPTDWWIPSPVTGQALSSLAYDKEAHYLIIDGLEAPEQLVSSATFEFRSQRFVLRLP